MNGEVFKGKKDLISSEWMDGENFKGKPLISCNLYIVGQSDMKHKRLLSFRHAKTTYFYAIYLLLVKDEASNVIEKNHKQLGGYTLYTLLISVTLVCYPKSLNQ